MDSNWRNKFFSLFTAVGLALTLSACGGSGGGGGGGGGGGSTASTTALSVAESVSVVEVNSNGTASTAAVDPQAISALSVDFSMVAQAFDATGTDYSNQAQSKYTHDPSSEAMSTANFLLCVMGETGYDEPTLLNTTYVALVDSSKCEKGSNKSTGAGGSQSQSLATWVVKSSRASDTADQIVSVWADETNDGSTTRFFLRMVISEAATATNPYGTFVMQFGGRSLASDGTLSTTLDQDSGYLSIGDTGQPAQNGGVTQIGFNLSMTSKDSQRGGTITGVMISDLNSSGDSISGRAVITQKTTAGAINSKFNVAYNADYALLVDNANGDTQTCLSKSSFKESVWRYALFYDGAGQTMPGVANVGKTSTDGGRVDLNSGFPFTTKLSNGDTEYGYVGYWGVFMPEGASVTTGTTITKETFGSGTGADYTVVKAPGKLIKFTRKTADSAFMDGVEFSYWDSTGNQLKLVWDDATKKFKQTAFWNNSGSYGGYWDTTGFSTPVAYVIKKPTWGVYPWRMNMYSEQLGGNVMFELTADDTITNVSNAVAPFPFAYNVEEVVSASQADTTFYCWTRCLQGGFATMDGSTEYEAGIYNPATAAYSYTYTKSTMSLSADNNSTDVTTTATGSGGNSWGTRSGPMVTTNPTTLGLSSVWDLYDQTTFYEWETGPNSWNTYTAVKASDGTLQTFDKPISMTYTHTTANDRIGDTTYNGKKYQMQYGGFGDLWGIPWVGEGDATQERQRWYPIFALKDGTKLSDGTTNYVVKALDIERKPNATAASNCSSMTAGSNTEPAADATLTFDDPGDPTATNYIGVRPDPVPLDVKMSDGILQ